MLTVLPSTPLTLWLMSPSLSRSRRVAVTPAMASAVLMSDQPSSAGEIFLQAQGALAAGGRALRRRCLMHCGDLDAPDADMHLGGFLDRHPPGRALGPCSAFEQGGAVRSLLRREQRLDAAQGPGSLVARRGRLGAPRRPWHDRKRDRAYRGIRGAPKRSTRIDRMRRLAGIRDRPAREHPWVPAPGSRPVAARPRPASESCSLHLRRHHLGAPAPGPGQALGAGRRGAGFARREKVPKPRWRLRPGPAATHRAALRRNAPSRPARSRGRRDG